MKTWLAIGDSFTYIDAHLEESNFRIQEGYLTLAEKRLDFPVQLINAGINGASTRDFADYLPPKADFYTILLGTNDWWGALFPLGGEEDFRLEKNTTLGNLGRLIHHIRQIAPTSPVFLLSPVERGRFVYQFDMANTALDSTYGGDYGSLALYAQKILSLADFDPLIVPVDTHVLSGFAPANAVKYMLVDGKKLAFEEIHKLPLDYRFSAYPYPKECEGMTYDGLHPSNKGSAILGKILANAINEYYKKQ